MNLSKLFKIQEQLDERIVKEKGLEGQDLLDKKILALQVELGELANCWRGFKFWSHDQEPRIEKRTYKTCPSCNGEYVDSCWMCGHSGQVVDKIINPLLEEFVDCLHFFLSIGLDLDINTNGSYFPSAGDDVLIQFAVINRYVAELWWECHDNGKNKSVKWLYAFSRFIKLAELLGFTWDEIEQSYLEKIESIMKGN